MESVTLTSIQTARARIGEAIHMSPCHLSHHLSELTGLPLHLKLENLQRTGSFKERGALNKLLTLTEYERKRGVIAASAGNHAQGVAFHAAARGIRAPDRHARWPRRSSRSPPPAATGLRSSSTAPATTKPATKPCAAACQERPHLHSSLRRPRRDRRTGNNRPRTPRSGPRHRSRRRPYRRRRPHQRHRLRSKGNQS